MLVKFLMKLRNEPVSITLKNGNVIEGTTSGLDRKMNTHLINVTLRKTNGQDQQLDSYTVRGTTIESFDLSQVKKAPVETFMEEKKDKKKRNIIRSSKYSRHQKALERMEKKLTQQNV